VAQPGDLFGRLPFLVVPIHSVHLFITTGQSNICGPTSSGSFEPARDEIFKPPPRLTQVRHEVIHVYQSSNSKDLRPERGFRPENRQPSHLGACYLCRPGIWGFHLCCLNE
jgi:hypothetical protein